MCGLGGSTVRLRTGTKRLRLPDEFNPTKIYQAIAGDPRTGNGEEALDILASIFENRGQLDRAADYLKQSREEYGEKDDRSKTKRLDQILGAWGEFVGTRPQSAGQAASVDFRFRNGRRVHFEAHEILFNKLLQDVKDYISSRPLTSIVEPKPAERTKATEEDRRLVPQRESNILDRELAVPPMVVEADRQLAPVLSDSALDEKKITSIWSSRTTRRPGSSRPKSGAATTATTWAPTSSFTTNAWRSNDAIIPQCRSVRGFAFPLTECYPGKSFLDRTNGGFPREFPHRNS